MNDYMARGIHWDSQKRFFVCLFVFLFLFFLFVFLFALGLKFPFHFDSVFPTGIFYLGSKLA